VSSGLALLAFLLGLGLSLGASEVLVSALGRLGPKLGLSAGLLGLLVALGADSPEISSAIAASVSGARDVGVGVILGSNLFNIAALLGLSAVLAGRLRFRRPLLALDGGVSMSITLVVALLLLTPVTPVLSMGLMLLLIVPYVVVLSTPRGGERSLPQGEQESGIRWRAWWLAPAVAAIVAGSTVMVNMALLLGDRWHLPRGLLGTVVLAALTSLPNAYAAIRLALAGNGAAVVSAAFNSNTLNLVAGIGLPALFYGGIGAAPDAPRTLAWLLLLTLAAICIGIVREQLGRIGGVLLIAIYAAFLGIALR
jgi:cation:H+ antiporter